MSGKAKNKLLNFFSGDFIITRGLDRQLGFVFFIFVIFICVIFWSILVESRLVKVEENNRKIESLTISRDQRTVELLGIDRRSCVEDLLKKNNSTLVPPTEPARTIEDLR